MPRFKFSYITFIISIVLLLFATTFSGCRREVSPRKETPLVGTWLNYHGLEKQFHDDGTWNISVEGTPNVRGTFTLDDNTITRRMTHLHGALFDHLEYRWYSQTELNTAIQRDINNLFALMILIPFDRQTEIYTYEVSGDTVIFTYSGEEWDEDDEFTQTFVRR